VWERLVMASFYCRKDDSFMTLVSSNPDAYGPFWISTLLIFTLAVTTQISGFLDSWLSGSDWAYNFQSVVTAATVVYTFAAAAPVTIYFVLRQFGLTTPLMTIVCLYGYSLLSFIPAALLCLTPVGLLDWLAMLSACVIR
jgi:hypothetical protein